MFVVFCFPGSNFLQHDLYDITSIFLGENNDKFVSVEYRSLLAFIKC
jgi:hypothetical protein